MTEPSPTPTVPPLDEVMLAMDVVDTLRAHRELVAKELDDEGRAASFADRVKSIYASQGIDVPDTVIREAVDALEQDRFVYEPPKRTLGVRLAELYVDRGRWFRRLLGVGAIVALVWGGMSWSKARHDRGLEEAFSARQGLLSRDVETTSERIAALRRQIAEIDQQRPEATIVGGLTMQALALLSDVEDRLRRMASDATPLPVESYPDDQRRMDAQLEARRRAVADVHEDLGRVEGQLEAIRRLQGLSGTIAVTMAQLGGIELTEPQRAELERLRSGAQAALATQDVTTAEEYVQRLRQAVSTHVGAAEKRRRVRAAFQAVTADLGSMDVQGDVQGEVDQLGGRVRAAIESGDLVAAERHLGELRTLAQVLGLAYEMQIVSRPGQQSGVWRVPDDRPQARNYYILVEPIGPDGRPVAIPVRNEENQTTRLVTQLGVRVPESVFEAVKQDKLDNGIVDRRLFGVKRRGQKAPEYRFEVVGGWITDW